MAANCLDDIRIIELARFQALPRGGMLLRDLGAEVIKVESPKGEGDLRPMGPFVHGQSVQFAAYNRGKKSITLELRTEEGRAILGDLVRCSDVLLENFRPGVLETMGYTQETLSRLNPTLVLCRVSGFGQYGPYRDWGSFDPTIQAMSGLAHQTGRPFGRPVLAEGPIMDRLTAIHAAAGVTAALRYRDWTGKGQVIDVAMLDMGISLEEVALAMAHFTGNDDWRRGYGAPLHCADGWVDAGSVRNAKWRPLLEAMGRHELAATADFTAPLWTAIVSPERLELLQSWASDRARVEVLNTLRQYGLECVFIQTITDVLHDPHFSQREVMVELPVDEQGNTMLMPGVSIKMSGVTTPLQGPPRLGEHNREVLGGVLGIPGKELDRLRACGVI